MTKKMKNGLFQLPLIHFIQKINQNAIKQYKMTHRLLSDSPCYILYHMGTLLISFLENWREKWEKREKIGKLAKKPNFPFHSPVLPEQADENRQMLRRIKRFLGFSVKIRLFSLIFWFFSVARHILPEQ